MSNFQVFKQAVQKQFELMTTDNDYLFTTDIDKELLWSTYLDSFPTGTNEVYKTNREFDCNCCKAFIRKMGKVVAIKNNQMVSIWDIDVPAPFDVVAQQLSRLIKTQSTIINPFFHNESFMGTDVSHKLTEDNDTITWEHFYLNLPRAIVKRDADSIQSIQGKIRDSRNVFKRSLDELTLDATQTVLELIEQGSLYRGEEFKPAIQAFIATKNEYKDIPVDQQDLWTWIASANSPVSRIRNTAIGTLLINLSEGVELDVAVGKFEAVVAPTNYKRPKAIITKRMIADAQKKIEDLGFTNSLGRRHASLDDIKINNVLFLNRHAKKSPEGVFEEMADEVAVVPKNFNKVEEVTIDHFVENILPSAKSIHLMMENKHQGNLATLIAPKDTGATTMFKWDNNFSWSYNGDIADSMKQHVKNAGGKVDGVLRFSIQWNDGDNNQNDFDAHCHEPKGNLISFSHKTNQSTGGNLDVDIIDPGHNVAVENITWPDINKMQEGKYHLLVHNYSHNGGTTGFTAEIEYEGEIYSYTYARELRHGEKVTVAKLNFSKTDGITFIESLDSQYSQKELWGVKTNSFVEVSSMMRSPNYWDMRDAGGNKHYFFFLNGCVNKDNPRGFYNEFLKEDLLKHKRVFEALGSKMRVEHSNEQLSGLGFSSTQRSSVIAKIGGSFDRVIKINF